MKIWATKLNCTFDAVRLWKLICCNHFLPWLFIVLFYNEIGMSFVASLLLKKYFQTKKKKNLRLQFHKSLWLNGITILLEYYMLIRLLLYIIGILCIQFSCSVMSDILRPHESQHTRPPCPSTTPRVYPNSSIKLVMPSNLSPSSPPAFKFSQHQGLFQWFNSLHQVSEVLEFQLQHQSFWWIPRSYLLDTYYSQA